MDPQSSFNSLKRKSISFGPASDDRVLNSEKEMEQKTVEIVTYPEGGRRAWAVVLGVWIVQFCTCGHTNAYGVYNDFYVREYMNGKYSSFQLSWIGSVQLMLFLSAGLFTGRAFDIGYFYHMMIGGSFLFVFCLFMLSLTQPSQYYQVFLAQGFGAGLATGILYVPSLGVVSQYFRRRRALALGIATSGAGIGGAVQSIMLNKLIHSSLGFHRAVRISAAFNLGLLAFALLIIRTRLAPSSKKGGSTLADMRNFFSELPYIFTVIGTIFTLAGLYFPIFFLQLSAIKNGVDPDLAFYLLTIVNASRLVGSLLPNYFLHRTGAFNAVVLCTLGCSIMIFCLLAVKSVVSTMIFAVLYGFFAGAYFGVFAPVVSSLAKTDSEIGARMGICFTFTGLGGLAGSPVAGALLSPSFVWWRPTVFAGLCVSCGSLSFFLARGLLARRKGTQIV